MINKILTTVMITTALVATSASADACSNLKSQTKSKLGQCKSIGKGKAGYGKCVKDFRKLKSKFKLSGIFKIFNFIKIFKHVQISVLTKNKDFFFFINDVTNFLPTYFLFEDQSIIIVIN